MRKAVAVPYVIALILGVAVIGLIGVFFVTTGGKFSGQAAVTQCNTDKVQWCVNWGANNYGTTKPATPPSCTSAGIAMPADAAACKALLGLS